MTQPAHNPNLEQDSDEDWDFTPEQILAIKEGAEEGFLRGLEKAVEKLEREGKLPGQQPKTDKSAGHSA